MSDEDISIHEKRVYADKSATTTALVASSVGVTEVKISDDIVGEFSLAHRCQARDVATGNGRAAVATEADVLVGVDGEFVDTGFGPASAVGYGDGLVAAGGGRIARYDGDDWEQLSTVENVRAIDGDFAAAAGGVYRLDGTHVGLDDAYDVVGGAEPLAATGSGLYYLANGWMEAADGSFHAVAGGSSTAAHAVGDGTLFEQNEEWTAVELPTEESVVDVAHGDGAYAVTETGTVLATVGDGWRHRALGLPDVSGLAVL
ncbi:uncharacterized protein NP_5160A [Natronomonas pharaonis DSM 2160]|uniref:HVO-0234-like beta-propeller domain-containing protein n=1 Tax=Natronomonas pharaonis (strain ATCC 35678 / DSM 2160 / CIP 103997 / JCM 8858 / NBRC 14720 / NCIMB 2260 / Gabara) TaxID=348780 RepID=A0A1U7EZF9_NATPD|nr:hypothetical protein [Natronomonas pharaonis]CAI50671.1 uncharacterized protein NP_5160A [Natronomonas pharaonis DSM 2160]